MKKLFSNLFLLGLLIPFGEVTKANEYQFFKTSSEIIDSIPTVKFYGVSSSGTETLLNTWESTTTDVESFSGDLEDARVDQYTGKIYFEVNEDKDDDTFISTVLEYDLLNNTVQKLEGISDIEEIVIYPRGINNMISKDDSTGVLSLGENSLKMKE